jgi:c(7)-type cytochrome triheme protein
LLLASCASAAAVFLDLPQEEESRQRELDEATASPAPATPVPEVQPQAVYRDTVREPLPIEQTLDPDSVLAMLPRTVGGSLDWNEAIRQGVIDPQAGRDTNRNDPADFGYDFYFGDFETFFPHSEHVAWVSCGSCHPSIYRTRGTKTTMEDISEGTSCGTCHGTVAFAVEACDRCHTALSMAEGGLQPDLGGEFRFRRDSTTEISFVPSVFPHWVHRVRYKCAACHPDPFPMSLQPLETPMAEMQQGSACGECHDGEAAFGLMDCNRCHKSEEAPEG